MQYKIWQIIGSLTSLMEFYVRLFIANMSNYSLSKVPEGKICHVSLIVRHNNATMTCFHLRDRLMKNLT